MPPKSLQPSAVEGKQTPGRVLKPQQGASFVPVKLPALRAVVPAPTAVKTPVLYPACVVACFTSLISALKSEKSVVPPLLLFPPNPLRWASAGALNRPRKLPQNSRKCRNKRLRRSLHPASMRKPLTGAYSGQQRAIMRSVHPWEACNRCLSSQRFSSFFQCRKHAVVLPAAVHGRGRQRIGYFQCDISDCHCV